MKKRHGQSKRLVITQSRKHDGMRERERVTIYEEDIAAFLAELMKAVAAMGESASHVDWTKAAPIGTAQAHGPSPDRYAAIRAKYPNAYKPWTQEEDEELIELEVGGMSIHELAERFQRKPGAIRSRIRKLADEWQ